MNPVLPLPDPLPQPAPHALLWSLLQLTFLLHVLAMNVVLGGSLLALAWRRGRPQDAAPRAALLRAFEKALPAAIAATVTLGVAPLLFVQVLYGRVFFTSSILMGWFWLALVPLLILAYYGAYRVAFRGGVAARWTGALVALLVSTVAFLQVTNASRALRPDSFAAAYRAEARGLTLNLDDPTLWPRYFHLLLGAIAVAALAAAVYGASRRRADPDLARFAVRRGTAVFAAATAANVFVGMLLLIALPRAVLVRLVGGDRWSVLLLVCAILLAVALGGAAVLALGARRPSPATPALAVLAALTVAVMLLLRDDVRRLTLENAGVVPPARVLMQWSPFAVFAVCFVAAVAAIAWMARALARGPATLSE
jgi:hypothetical protein